MSKKVLSPKTLSKELNNQIKKDDSNLETIQELINNGADINYQDRNNMTALVFAVMNNHIKIVKLLLERPDINVNIQNNFSMSALIVAASKENNEIVKLLLGHPNINVNIQDYLERTALIVAVSKENNETVKLLLENPNINVDIKNEDGNTALMMAAPKKNTEIINLLLEHPNININIQNKLGRTALMLTATQGTTENLMNILRKNPDTDIKNNDGNTALMMATKAKKYNIINILNKHERKLERRKKTLFVNEMTREYGFVMTPDTLKQLYEQLKKESPPNGGGKSHRKRKTGKADRTKKRRYRNK